VKTFYPEKFRIPQPAAYNLQMPEIKPLADEAFLEMRWRCLSLAADLDRADRAGSPKSDARLVKLREAISVLLDSNPNRAERVQLIFSDKSPRP
jgi:hypothetical protein